MKKLCLVVTLFVLATGLVACRSNINGYSEHEVYENESSYMSEEAESSGENMPINFVVGDFITFHEEQGPPINAISLRYIEGIHYLFLPYWSIGSDIVPYFTGAHYLALLGDEEIRHGYPINHLQHGQELQFSMDDISLTVIPLIGSGIPTIFINTDSGSLEYIHEDQSNRENTTFLFVDGYGNLEFFGYGDMNGRGNWTWLQDKRPYNFRLSSGTNLPLFGLREGRHWTLLANYLDNTLIRNQVALNLAREVNMLHTSHLLPVDLFINNEYQGVYDLVERRNINHAVNISDMGAATAAVNSASLSSFPHMGVHAPEAGTFRYFDIPHDPSDITGDFMLELQLRSRYLNRPSGFVTNLGTPVVLISPAYATRKQIEYISTFFQRLEDAVYSEMGYNSYGNHFSYYLDVESFALMYILLEFTMEYDAGRTSFFVIKESNLVGSGKIYAAPPWDFDNTFGARRDTSDPNVFFANGGRPSATNEDIPHILTALNMHESFREEVINLWRADFAPSVRVLIGYDNDNDTYILESMQSSMDRILESAYMNRIIWPNPITYTTDLINIARDRYHFLESQWGNQIEY